MRQDYATVNDVEKLYRKLSEVEAERATYLIPVVCDRLRMEADNTGRDLDLMIYGDGTVAHPSNEALKNTARSVVVDIVARILQTPTTGAPMSQFSESGNGYVASGTFLNPGGGIFIKKAELQALGLRRQRIGVVSLYGNNT